MKKFITFIILSFLTILGSQSFAQHVPVLITIDTSFGLGGKVEVNVGGFNDETKGLDVTHDSKVTTVCGKVSTPDAGVFHLGMIRVDSTGKLDAGFGTNGIVNFTWDTSDYPNWMERQPDNITDSMFILAGGAGTNSSLVPSVYRLKKNGTPDSNFGENGRLMMKFDDHSGGEAVSVSAKTAYPQYVVCGKSIASDAQGKTGFGVMTINGDGTLDTSFGDKGRMVIPAPVHSVQGFFLNDRHIFMCGISDSGSRELIIAHFTEKGQPDTSIAVKGLIHTGIVLTGDTIMAQFEQGDNKVVMLLPTSESSPTHIVIRRFDEYGRPDSTYGKNGIGTNDILPSFEPKGLFIASDLSEIISGKVNAGLGNSIFVRISDTTAVPDPIFNHNGIISIDIDSGRFSNYLTFVEPIGKVDLVGNIKRFIGVGGSVQNGTDHFMVVRMIGYPANSVAENNSGSDVLAHIFPDPVTSSFKIEDVANEITDIRIVNALGIEVMDLGAENNFNGAKVFSANAANIPNGLYYCIARSRAHQWVQKFIVSH